MANIASLEQIKELNFQFVALEGHNTNMSLEQLDKIKVHLEEIRKILGLPNIYVSNFIINRDNEVKEEELVEPQSATNY